MRRFISLTALNVRRKMKQCLACILTMFVLETAYIYIQLKMPGTWLSVNYDRIVLIAAACFLCAARDKKDGSTYTLQRLGMSKAGRFFAAAAADLLYFLLYFAAWGTAAVFRLWAAERAGLVYGGPQGKLIYLFIKPMEGILTAPMTGEWVVTLALIILLPLISAAVSEWSE